MKRWLGAAGVYALFGCSPAATGFEVEEPLSRTPASADDAQVPAASVVLPKPLRTVETRLANGMRAQVVQRPGSGLVDLVFVNPRARFGAEYLPVFLGDALLAGVDPGDGSLLYPVGLDGRLPRVTTGPSGTTVALKCRAERFAEALDLLESTVRRPRFEAPLLESIRARTALYLLDVRSQYWSWELASAHHGTFFRINEQSVADELRNVDPATLQRAHHKLFGPRETSLVVVGDVSAAEASSAVSERFSSWSESPPETAPPLGPVAVTRPAKAGKRRVVQQSEGEHVLEAEPVPTEPGRHVIVVSDEIYPTVSIIQDAPPLKGPDTLPFTLLLEVLNAANSPLMQKLRYERGDVYSVGLRLVTVPEQGRYVFLKTKSAEQTLTADVSVILNELARLGSEALSEQELNGAKARHAAELAESLSSGSGIAWYLARQALQEASPLDDVTQKMAAITAEDLRRVAQRYLDPERATIVVQGNVSSNVVAALGVFGTVFTR